MARRKRLTDAALATASRLCAAGQAVLPARTGAYTLQLTNRVDWGWVMTDWRTTGEPIDLDPNELLGLSQVAKVSRIPGKAGCAQPGAEQNRIGRTTAARIPA